MSSSETAAGVSTPRSVNSSDMYSARTHQAMLGGAGLNGADSACTRTRVVPCAFIKQLGSVHAESFQQIKGMIEGQHLQKSYIKYGAQGCSPSRIACKLSVVSKFPTLNKQHHSCALSWSTA